MYIKFGQTKLKPLQLGLLALANAEECEGCDPTLDPEEDTLHEMAHPQGSPQSKSNTAPILVPPPRTVEGSSLE